MNVTRSFDGDINRYDFDWNDCNRKQGFAQVDTSQDFSHYGAWANPFTLTLVTFAEGDITESTADTQAEFLAELVKMRDWHHEQGDKFGIDALCDDKLISEFKSIGAGELLH